MTPLDLVEENRQVRVMDIQGGWGVRRRLGQLGIHPGDVITVVRYGAFQGPILIQVHGSQVALGRGIASRILVKESE
jgi:ferrous iron transport protein A